MQQELVALAGAGKEPHEVLLTHASNASYHRAHLTCPSSRYLRTALQCRSHSPVLRSTAISLASTLRLADTTTRSNTGSCRQQHCGRHPYCYHLLTVMAGVVWRESSRCCVSAARPDGN